ARGRGGRHSGRGRVRGARVVERPRTGGLVPAGADHRDLPRSRDGVARHTAAVDAGIEDLRNGRGEEPGDREAGGRDPDALRLVALLTQGAVLQGTGAVRAQEDGRGGKGSTGAADEVPLRFPGTPGALRGGASEGDAGEPIGG